MRYKNTTMFRNLIKAISLPLFLGLPLVACTNGNNTTIKSSAKAIQKVCEIPLPAGYSRVVYDSASFSYWLQQFALKSDPTVYLYNGDRKRNQWPSFAVLNISTGNKDLQQCADAVMRLRAEYLYEKKTKGPILFFDNNRKEYRFSATGSRTEFNKYLEHVFSWCGTLSLASQLKAKKSLEAIRPGDVFIKGGSPGHAALVMDVAENNAGDKIFLLMNSYMPAQDMHIVKNPSCSTLSPWYSIRQKPRFELPEWVFYENQLMEW